MSPSVSILVMLLSLVGCNKQEPARADPTPMPTPTPTPTPIPTPPAPVDAPSERCLYTIYQSFLQPLEDGRLLVAPEAFGSAEVPQHGPEQIVSADGSVQRADGAPHRRRDRTLYLSDDNGALCGGDGKRTLDCTDFQLSSALAKLGGYAAAGHDPKGRSFALSFFDHGKEPWEGFVVGFDGAGKQLARWTFARGCMDERPVLVAGRTVVLLCQRTGDRDSYSSLIVRDVTTGKQHASIPGRFEDMTLAVVDDTHFVAYRPDIPAIEAYDLTRPSKPTRVWQTPTALVKPAIEFALGAVFVVARTPPWQAVLLDPATGSVRREIAIPCR